MIRLAVLAFTLSAVFLPLGGQAAGSMVPATRLGVVHRPVSANALKPGFCSSVNVAQTFIGAPGR